jgi:hypothetical protein
MKNFDTFEDDIKELFGMIEYDKPSNVDRSKRTDVFRRYMEAIFTWDEKKHPKNFRLKFPPSLPHRRMVMIIIGTGIKPYLDK